MHMDTFYVTMRRSTNRSEVPRVLITGHQMDSPSCAGSHQDTLRDLQAEVIDMIRKAGQPTGDDRGSL